MEAKELELVEKYRKDNYEVDHLYQEHVILKEKVLDFENMKGLSVSQEKEMKEMKVKKLEGKEKLLVLLNSLENS